jgi:hypothetical protein
MNTRLMTVTTAAIAIAGAITLGAQAPQNPPPQPQTRPQPTTEAQRPMSDQAKSAAQTIVIAGCLKEEKDVPGLKPNVAERAGIGEDYILTNVKMAPTSAVSGIALATNYEVEGPSADELKKHLNHQVELTGTITQPTTTATDDTPDFKATSVKMVSATCAAK